MRGEGCVVANEPSLRQPGIALAQVMTVAVSMLFNPSNDEEKMRNTAGYIIATAAGT